MASFTRPMCVLVTGANRGFGEAVCLSLATKLQPHSALVLLGRTEEGLKATQAGVLNLNPGITTHIYSNFECGNLDCDSLTIYLKAIQLPGTVTDLLVIHNAGTVGDPSQSSLNTTLQSAQEYMNVNFSSAVAANSVFLEVFSSLSNKTVVNVTSLCGVLATKTVALYCAGKAAREMFFKVMALEKPDVRVLSYAPGPLKTDMFYCIRDNSYDSEVKSMFEGTSPLECITSSDRLVEILALDKYKSGDHVDYFDELPK